MSTLVEDYVVRYNVVYCHRDKDALISINNLETGNIRPTCCNIYDYSNTTAIDCRVFPIFSDQVYGFIDK
jgi:hypothetical protein